MIFVFVSKVSTRNNNFEGQSQGQGHAKVTFNFEAEKSLKQSFYIAIRPNLKYTFPETSAALPYIVLCPWAIMTELCNGW